MSRLIQRPIIELDVAVRFTEIEMRALEAISGYDVEVFLNAFYETMGRHYLEPHADGIRSLFKTVRGELPPILRRLDAAKTAFALDNPVIRSRADHNALIQRLTQKGPA